MIGPPVRPRARAPLSASRAAAAQGDEPWRWGRADREREPRRAEPCGCRRRGSRARGRDRSRPAGGPSPADRRRRHAPGGTPRSLPGSSASAACRGRTPACGRRPQRGADRRPGRRGPAVPPPQPSQPQRGELASQQRRGGPLHRRRRDQARHDGAVDVHRHALAAGGAAAGQIVARPPAGPGAVPPLPETQERRFAGAQVVVPAERGDALEKRLQLPQAIWRPSLPADRRRRRAHVEHAACEEVGQRLGQARHGVGRDRHRDAQAVLEQQGMAAAQALQQGVKPGVRAAPAPVLRRRHAVEAELHLEGVLVQEFGGAVVQQQAVGENRVPRPPRRRRRALAVRHRPPHDRQPQQRLAP